MTRWETSRRSGRRSASSDSGEASVSATSVDDTVLIVWHNFSSTPGPFRRVEAVHMKTDGTIGPLVVPDSTAGATGVHGVARRGRQHAARLETRAALSRDRTSAPTTRRARSAHRKPTRRRSPRSAADGHGKFDLLYANSAPGSHFSLDFRPLSPDGSGGTERNIDPLGSSFVSHGLIAMNSSARASSGGRGTTPPRRASSTATRCRRADVHHP